MSRYLSASLSPLVLLACVHAPPGIYGGPAAPSAPNTLWSPPARVAERAALDTARVAAAPPIRSLADVVDIALRNNPVTRLSWAQARAAAEAYGATRGQLYPSVDADVSMTRSRSLATTGRPAVERTQYGPALSLSYLVLDFGGRAGTIDVARQTVIAADLAHNAAIENTILEAESAAFGYLANRALRDAQKSSVSEATAALEAASERHRVGLGTIADVLQARTARSQSQLTLQTLEGAVEVARGGVAVAMGFPANTRVDLPADLGAPDSVHFVGASVDSLIDAAVRNRPELGVARAEAAGAAAAVRVARSASLPSFGFASTGASNGSNVSAFAGRPYTLTLGVQIPLFNGFSRQYDVRAAGEQLRAATARADVTKQQIIQQVFTAYYALRTATDRVRTTTDLLASATQSESVASGRYREGVGNIVDVLIAQAALATARAQGVEARWQWRTALAQLAHDVGVLGLRGEPLLPRSGQGGER